MCRQERLKKWKHTGKPSCTGLSAFLSLTARAKCFCSSGHWESIIVPACGPTPVVLIRIREKKLKRRRPEGLEKKWDLILHSKKSSILFIALNSITDSQNMNSITSTQESMAAN